jgi:hypothetical protein
MQFVKHALHVVILVVAQFLLLWFLLQVRIDSQVNRPHFGLVSLSHTGTLKDLEIICV